MQGQYMEKTGKPHQHSDEEQKGKEGESIPAGEYLKELNEQEKRQLNDWCRETFPSRST